MPKSMVLSYPISLVNNPSRDYVRKQATRLHEILSNLFSNPNA